MTSPKKHHYNPRYYLEGFQSEDGKLWRLEKPKGTIVEGSAKTLGNKKYWNRLTKPPRGVNPNQIEINLAKVDNAAIRVLRELIDGNLPKSIEPLALAVSFMLHHQPALKQALLEDHPETVERWSDDEFVVRGINAAIDAWDEFIPKNYIVFTLPTNRPDLHFLTSSNPLIRFDNSAQMFFPISSRHCLFLNMGDELSFIKNQVREISDPEEVIGINRRTIENSWQYIYSDRPHFD